MADESSVTPEPGAEAPAPAKRRGRRAKSEKVEEAVGKILDNVATAVAEVGATAKKAIEDQMPKARQHGLTLTEADTLRCEKCGQPGMRCKGQHAVIDLVPTDLWAKSWQGINLNGVKYDGPKVTVPADAAQEMLSRLNNWQRGEASRLLPKKQIQQTIATLSGR